MCSESKTTKPVRPEFVNDEVDLQGLDGEVLDDGFADLVWPDAPRETPVDEAGRDEEEAEEEAEEAEEEEEEDEEEEDNDAERVICNEAEEGQAAKPIRSPREPSKEEIDEHQLTHVP